MVQDSSAIGVMVRLTASITYPYGVNFTAFPEDGDVGVTGNTDIAGNASGINGDLIWWKTVAGIEVNIPVIPNTEADSLLEVLFDANRGSKNRYPKKDIIQLVVTNPITGIAKTYKNGVIKNGAVGNQYGGDGRIKTKTYGFVFEDAV